MFDLRKCQVDPSQKPIKMMLSKEEKIARLKEDITNWDEKFLKTQGRAGKRRLQAILHELQSKPQ